MTIRYLFVLSCAFGFSLANAEVTELSNTEMTEAYIQDGAIIIKQRPVQTNPAPKQKVNITVGPGEPVVSEATKVGELEDSNNLQRSLIQQEYSNTNNTKQFDNFEFTQSVNGANTPVFQTTAQAQRDLHAQNLVRQGLGLPDGTDITQDMMVQYLQTFSGQTSGDVLGAHQVMTNNGLQIVIPNPGGQFESGVFPSGDQSMNVETTNQQIIFNLLFPKQQ